jgi:hypothetical protein
MLPASSDIKARSRLEHRTSGGLVCEGCDGVDYERGEDGVWRYRGTDAVVPGAEDVLLGEVTKARLVVRPGEEPEAVLVSLTEIQHDRRLAWVLELGTRLSGGEDELFAVSWPTWQEHVGQPVDVRVPERDAEGIDRAIARRERAVRLQRHQLERATEGRQVIVGVAAGLGVTRRHVADLIGVSTGRIQQLIDDAPRRVQLEVERILRDAPTILKLVENEPRHREQVSVPKDWSAGQVSEMLDQLVDLGLLSTGERHGTVWRSQAGERALAHLASKRRRKAGTNRGPGSTT